MHALPVWLRVLKLVTSTSPTHLKYATALVGDSILEDEHKVLPYRQRRRRSRSANQQGSWETIRYSSWPPFSIRRHRSGTTGRARADPFISHIYPSLHLCTKKRHINLKPSARSDFTIFIICSSCCVPTTITIFNFRRPICLNATRRGAVQRGCVNGVFDKMVARNSDTTNASNDVQKFSWPTKNIMRCALHVRPPRRALVARWTRRKVQIYTIKRCTM